jgi:outer membrane lipoprotein
MIYSLRAIRYPAAMLWLMLGLAMATSCAVISDEVSHSALPPLPFAELIQKAGDYQGQTVVVGGYVVSVANHKDQTRLVAVQAPLGVGQQPQSKDLSQGRIIFIYEGFIDPEVFTKDRQITVGGSILGSSSTEKPQHPFPYLRVQVKEIHLWPKPKPVSAVPYWGDDCYPYPYGRWWRYRNPCW